MRLGHSVGAAITRQRELGPAESVIMLWGAAMLLGVAGIAVVWPKVIAYPIAGLAIWVTASLLVRAVELRRRGKAKASRAPDEKY